MVEYKINLDGLERPYSKEAFMKFYYMVSDSQQHYTFSIAEHAIPIPFRHASEEWVVNYQGSFLSNIFPNKSWNSLFPKVPIISSEFWQDHEGHHLEVRIMDSSITMPVLGRMRDEVQYLTKERLERDLKIGKKR